MKNKKFKNIKFRYEKDKITWNTEEYFFIMDLKSAKYFIYDIIYINLMKI